MESVKRLSKADVLPQRWEADPDQIDTNFKKHEDEIAELGDAIARLDSRTYGANTRLDELEKRLGRPRTRSVSDEIQDLFGKFGTANQQGEYIQNIFVRLAALEAAKDGDGLMCGIDLGANKRPPTMIFMGTPEQVKAHDAAIRAVERQRAAGIVRAESRKASLFGLWNLDRLIDAILDGAENNTPDVTVREKGYSDFLRVAGDPKPGPAVTTTATATLSREDIEQNTPRFTQADLDAAVKDAVEKVAGQVVYIEDQEAIDAAVAKERKGWEGDSREGFAFYVIDGVRHQFSIPISIIINRITDRAVTEAVQRTRENDAAWVRQWEISLVCADHGGDPISASKLKAHILAGDEAIWR